jgi:uncharacterized damage-inducible protein DinB
MDLPRYLLAQAYNNGWANHRLYKACMQLGQGEFEATRSNFFPTIKSTLNHILTVDWFYIDALERDASGKPSSSPKSRSPPQPRCSANRAPATAA